MEYGNIVLSTTPKSFVSKCIRWFTKSQFSHSFVTMPDVLNIPMCIEASEGGVDMSRFDSNYLDNKDSSLEVWTVNLPKDVKDKALSNIVNDLETGYGFLEYPWFIWRKINFLFGKDIKSHNNWNTDGMICSQLVVAYLIACGLGYTLIGYGNGSIAPEDLHAIILAHPELFTKSTSLRLAV